MEKKQQIAWPCLESCILPALGQIESSKNPVTQIRPALVLSSYYKRGTIQVAKDAAGSDASVFCLCAANSLWKLHLKDL